MPGPDRVQVTKVERAATGGDDADDFSGYTSNVPIEPQEDALESAGHYFQDGSNRDEAVYIDRSGDDLRFRDVNNPTPQTLSDLVAGAGGITLSQHKLLRQLIHFIDEGPTDGFASGSYKELTYSGALVTSVIWYTDNTKVDKIVELTITHTGAFPTTEVWKMYDTDGSTVLLTLTDSITYSGAFEQNRTRTYV